MSKETRNFAPKEVFSELCDQINYALGILRAARDTLLESKIAVNFNGKPPRPVIMHAVSRAVTEVKSPNLDYTKLHRGLISLCLFLLEDDDVQLALKIKDCLRDIKESGGEE